MAESRDMKADVLRTLGAKNVKVSYDNVGPALTFPLLIITFKNTTNVSILISEDGFVDHYELPPFSSDVLDLQGNARSNAHANKAVGLQFQAKASNGELPSKGKVIIQGQYL